MTVVSQTEFKHSIKICNLKIIRSLLAAGTLSNWCTKFEASVLLDVQLLYLTKP